jgi:hypothetical protein
VTSEPKKRGTWTQPFHKGEIRFREIDTDRGKRKELDELVAKDVRHVHVEVMSETSISMVLELGDGSQVNCTFYPRNNRSHIEYSAFVEGPRPPAKGGGSG